MKIVNILILSVFIFSIFPGSIYAAEQNKNNTAKSNSKNQEIEEEDTVEIEQVCTEASGAIKIISKDVGKKIYIDGGFAGSIPIENKIRVYPGKHTVSFFSEGDMQIVSNNYNEASQEYTLNKSVDRVAYTRDNGFGTLGSAIAKDLSAFDVEAIRAGTKSIFVQSCTTVKVHMNFNRVQNVFNNKESYRTAMLVLCVLGTVVLIYVAIAESNSNSGYYSGYYSKFGIVSNNILRYSLARF